jgi:hypothetical protein
MNHASEVMDKALERVLRCFFRHFLFRRIIVHCFRPDRLSKLMNFWEDFLAGFWKTRGLSAMIKSKGLSRFQGISLHIPLRKNILETSSAVAIPSILARLLPSDVRSQNNVEEVAVTIKHNKRGGLRTAHEAIDKKG